MNPVLKKIKRLIIQGNYVFTAKAEAERIADNLTEEDILESILNASFVRTKGHVVPGGKNIWKKST